jgi:hypothetical protein
LAKRGEERRDAILAGSHLDHPQNDSPDEEKGYDDQHEGYGTHEPGVEP